MADAYAPSSRPDPDALLAQIKGEANAALRGKLRIYFGSSAGVGKTYAMLAAARKAKSEHIEVVIGVIETHGRAETAALLDGLEQLPQRPVKYRGRDLREFDLDAALNRQPQLLLVDELAHSNVEGSRHPKRWQDVAELLEAGIDVWTALNVQHLESLNDVVGGITQVRVMETVPDHVFDSANEVVLVDVPADELLKRLKAGKVYLPEQAERAAKGFFRKGNLMALREIALRRTADRVEDDVQTYRDAEDIHRIWKTEAGLLACVGPTASAELVVRNTARLAGQLSVSWHAVYVETPALQRLPSVDREAILTVLKLAEDLQARTAVLASDSPAVAIAHYASVHNLSKVVLGNSYASTHDSRVVGWRELLLWFKRRQRHKRGLSQDIARLAPELDRIEVGHSADPSTRPLTSTLRQTPALDDRDKASDAVGTVGTVGAVKARSDAAPLQRFRFALTLLACAATTVLCLPLHGLFELANVVMIFLLCVVLVAVKFGRSAAALAAVVNVLSFDFFFVPPRFSFAVSDVQYLLTFSVMLIVGLITGHLTAGLRFQARIAGHREERVQTLFAFSRDLATALQNEQIIESSLAVLSQTFGHQVALILPDSNRNEQLRAAHSRSSAQPPVDLTVAQWAFDHEKEAGLGTDTLTSNHYRYLPLRAPVRLRGILALRPDNPRWLLIPEQRRYIETFASLIAMALERVHFVQVAQSMLVNVASERLRNSLLAALSHDLRTPLTALMGLTESLAHSKPALSASQAELTQEVFGSALRMHTMVNNLLDMARLESGDVRLRKDWQSIEELIGVTLRALQPALNGRVIEVRLPEDLPLVQIDAVLMERVFANLIENALKYTPENTPMEVTASATENTLTVNICDRGPGLPDQDVESLFNKFTRGEQESAKPGVGLGLSICKAIVTAHDGKIYATNRAGGGAIFSFDLPLPSPATEAEPAAQAALEAGVVPPVSPQ